MNEVLLFSIVMFLILTYKQLKVLKNKEVPRGNRRLAWSLYSFSVIVLVVINIYSSNISY